MRIFDEQLSRKPNLYPWTQEFINVMWEGHWTANEFSFKSDIHDFKTILSDEEKQIVIKTLSAIGQVEIAVKKFWARLGDNLPHPSLVDLGLVMAGVEVIHNTAYEKLLTVLGLEDSFQENLKVEVIEGRVKYLRKYLDKKYSDNKKQYVYALTLFTLFVENISLFSQFYIIMWFGRYKNVLKDTNQQILYTKNEELIHGLVGTKLINTIREEYPDLFDNELNNQIICEAREAYLAEAKIIDWIMKDYSGERINADILKEYVKHRINISLEGIGFSPLYEINPKLYRDFEWMNEEVLGNAMVDFFNSRPVDYSKNSRVISGGDLF